MKKLFTIMCAALLTFNLSAQMDGAEQGGYLFEGDSKLSFSSTTLNSATFDGDDLDIGDQDAVNSMNFKLVGGYFMMDGLAVGVLVQYASTSVAGTSSSSLTFGPMARYYIGESGMWSQLSYGMGSNSDTDVTTSSIGIGAGYAIMLSDYISFNPSLGYAMITESLDDMSYNYGGIVFSAGIGIHLGN